MYLNFLFLAWIGLKEIWVWITSLGRQVTYNMLNSSSKTTQPLWQLTDYDVEILTVLATFKR